MEINRKIKEVSVKRIWEVDCLSLDAAIAGSFEWRELANFIPKAEECFNLNAPESWLELELQLYIHSKCHAETEIALQLERSLNDLHRDRIKVIRELSVQNVIQLMFQFSFEKAEGLGGLFWAIGTDTRAGFSCVARRLHQRFQLVSMRRAIGR